MGRTRRTTLFASFILVALVLAGCNVRTIRGSGNVVEESRTVRNVSGVNLATIGELIIELGDTESFRIEAEDNLMEYLDTNVRNGSLVIGTQDRINLNATRPVTYYLTVTDLDSIKISSVGSIRAPDLAADRFSITIDSTGNLEMGDLETEALTVNITSTGDVTMGMLKTDSLRANLSSTGSLDIAGGEAKTQDITLRSTGNYTAQDLACEEADVRLNSTGSATIWVTDSLRARLQSTGDLHYVGNPVVDATANSTGSVRQIRQ